MSELLSYKNILDDIKNFKRSGTKFGNDFNLYDTPANKYFKILFYFGSAPEYYEEDSASGLLAPTWEFFKVRSVVEDDQITNYIRTDYYNFNSAWAFLKMNNEEERAEKLEHFITLLSDISTNSPWYFHKVGGIAEALERKCAEEGKMEVTDKKLTITCLPDAFDNRMTTLLELYRDVTWSWPQKKEIIPANLRKFDMAIYIFEAPERKWHRATDIIGSENDNTYKVAYKMIEFHDCEFNYNSIRSGWSELNNETGFAPTYTIDITYADCYEVSYNDIMMRKIGDVILTDLLNSSHYLDYISISQFDDPMQQAELKARTEDSGFFGTALGQLGGHFMSDLKSLYNRAVLGNLHTYSLTQIGSQLSEASKGNLIKTGMTIAQYIKNSKQNTKKEKPTGNIFKDTVANNL